MTGKMGSLTGRILKLALVLFVAILGFYVSLVFSAAALTIDQRSRVEGAIEILRSAGFKDEAFLLRRIVVFRSNDNWLNASVEKGNAFAATNFPFGIITLYPDFFERTTDDTERAAILLHEVRHVLGEDEKQAYEFVWKNRQKIGWVRDEYRGTELWGIVMKQTREHVPLVFICEFNIDNDCTASPRNRVDSIETP
jgi:hypothetical protein